MKFNRITGQLKENKDVNKSENQKYYDLHPDWYPVFHPYTKEYMGYINYYQDFIPKGEDLKVYLSYLESCDLNE